MTSGRGSATTRRIVRECARWALCLLVLAALLGIGGGPLVAAEVHAQTVWLEDSDEAKRTALSEVFEPEEFLWHVASYESPSCLMPGSAISFSRIANDCLLCRAGQSRAPPR